MAAEGENSTAYFVSTNPERSMPMPSPPAPKIDHKKDHTAQQEIKSIPLNSSIPTSLLLDKKNLSVCLLISKSFT